MGKVKPTVRQKGRKASRGLATEPAEAPYHLLEERSEVLRRLWEMSSEGIFVLRNGRVKECNHFLATRAGYAMDEIEGTCFASFFDRKSIPAVEAVCGQTTRGHEMMSLPKALLVCKNGSSIEVQLKACACLFGGKPAVLVTLRATDSQPSEDSWDADLDDFFVSEESPSILQRVI
jgi:PAS domain S-box-containing protein